MTLMEAAKKWNLSPNWVRELVKSGRIPSKLRSDVPVPYYEIPDGTPKPPSMARAPYRKGVGSVVTDAALKRRKTRDAARGGKPAARRKASAQKPKADKPDAMDE
jgi:hypothetical protein